MQGLGTMSYKELKECDGFDPKSLLTYDENDKEFDSLIKKIARTSCHSNNSIELDTRKEGNQIARKYYSIDTYFI